MRPAAAAAMVAALSCLIGLACTPVVRWLALRAGWVARPSADRWHQRSTALFGGDPTTLSEEELLSVYADAPSSEGRLDGATLLDLFAEALEGGSKSAARRTAGQGGAYVNNRQERDLDRPVTEDDLLAGRSLLLRKGRKRYHLVRFG